MGRSIVGRPGSAHLPQEGSPLLAVFGYSVSAYGGSAGGVVLFIRDNKLVVEHNTFGTHNTLASETPLPRGAAVLRCEYTPTGKTTAKGTLFINGRLAGSKEYNLPSTLFYT